MKLSIITGLLLAGGGTMIGIYSSITDNKSLWFFAFLLVLVGTITAGNRVRERIRERKAAKV